MKTKLGISTGLFAAILYGFGLFCGMNLVTFVALAYVLWKEEDKWLRKVAVRVTVLIFLFPLLSLLMGVIPDLIHLFESCLAVFDVYLDTTIITKIVNVYDIILGISKYVIFVLLAIFAFFRKPARVPVIDAIVDKEDKVEEPQA